MPDLGPRGLLALVRHGVVFELRLYRSLLRWLARRPHVPDGTEPFGYARSVTPVMWLWIFASAAEIPLAHLLVPWDTARIVLLVLGVWGLLWMVGFMASLNVYPHLLDRTGIRVRNGSSADIAVPWAAVSAVAPRRRDLDSTIRTLQPRDTEHGTDLQLGVSGQVNVHARLERPTIVHTAKGPMEIIELSFWSDDPRALATRARALMGSG